MLDARRRVCLQAMGIELWCRNGEAAAQPAIEATVPRSEPPPKVAEPPIAFEPRQDVRETDSVEQAASSPTAVEPVAVADDALPLGAPGKILRTDQLDWPALEQAVASCKACELHATRTQTVFGVGDRNASLLIIGEAPGADEDRQGEPFVGRAGQLLNAMLAAIGLQREQVYIANIIKCRPPGNRDPHTEEAAACQAFLHRQIALIQPRLILSIGRVSAHNLLGTEESVGRLRGRTHRFDPGDIPLIVSYHPAYLLRRPQEKAKAWQDLQAVHRLLHTAQ